MSERACHYCRTTEAQFAKRGNHDPLRPYGPGGSEVCFKCAFAPEREQQTENAFAALLDGAAAIGGGVTTLGGKRGPEPGFPTPRPEPQPEPMPSEQEDK